MRILVTWGSKHGGTEGIARILVDSLATRGFDVVAEPADRASNIDEFDAAIVGGALYAGLWPGSVRRFVRKNAEALSKIPTWFFSSGPLDDSAELSEIPPTKQVAVLAARVGAQDHVTFGGRLEADVKGFPAEAMAKEKAGDWRNPNRIKDWADDLAIALPTATPSDLVELKASSLQRLIGYGIIGWALCGAAMAMLLAITSVPVAQVIHAVVAPLFFLVVGWRYFRAFGARDPLVTAMSWVALAIVLDAVVSVVINGNLDLFRSLIGLWLPLLLIFLATWLIGSLMLMIPETGDSTPSELRTQLPTPQQL